jgi:hypothetical protein
VQYATVFFPNLCILQWYSQSNRHKPQGRLALEIELLALMKKKRKRHSIGKGASAQFVTGKGGSSVGSMLFREEIPRR